MLEEKIEKKKRRQVCRGAIALGAPCLASSACMSSVLALIRRIYKICMFWYENYRQTDSFYLGFEFFRIVEYQALRFRVGEIYARKVAVRLMTT